jgi:hypothetical protein
LFDLSFELWINNDVLASHYNNHDHVSTQAKQDCSKQDTAHEKHKQNIERMIPSWCIQQTVRIKEMPDAYAKDEQAQKWKRKHLQLNEAASGPAINMMEQFENEVTVKQDNAEPHGEGKSKMHGYPSFSARRHVISSSNVRA